MGGVGDAFRVESTPQTLRAAAQQIDSAIGTANIHRWIAGFVRRRQLIQELRPLGLFDRLDLDAGGLGEGRVEIFGETLLEIPPKSGNLQAARRAGRTDERRLQGGRRDQHSGPPQKRAARGSGRRRRRGDGRWFVSHFNALQGNRRSPRPGGRTSAVFSNGRSASGSVFRNVLEGGRLRNSKLDNISYPITKLASNSSACLPVA